MVHSFSMWRITAAAWGIFLVLVSAGGAEEGWDAWENPQEGEAFDPSSAPWAQLNEGRAPSAEEDAALQGVLLSPQMPGNSSPLEKAWEERGYGRPVGPEEKEKRPDNLFGNRDIKEEIRKAREGSY